VSASLTTLQRKTFFMGLRPAAVEVGMDPEDYRKLILREELGVEHMADVTRTAGFDKLMQRIWTDRGDYSRALEYAGGDVRRFRYLAESAARKIVGTDDALTVSRYIASVIVQMRYSYLDRDALAFKLQRVDGFDDFTPKQLKAVVAALNVHVRRRR